MPDAPTTPTTKITILNNFTNKQSITLPLPADVTSKNNYDSATGRYRYRISLISNKPSITFTPGEKVTLYVDGNMDFGNGDITHDCTGVSGCDATNAMIVGSPTNTNGSLNMQGNPALCNIFMWAPTYTAYVGGGGGGSSKCGVPTGAKAQSNNTGVYWVKDWDSNSNGSQAVMSDQNPALWPNIISVVNGLGAGIPITSTTTATYKKVAVSPMSGFNNVASNFTMPSPTVVASSSSSNSSASSVASSVTSSVASSVSSVASSVTSSVASSVSSVAMCNWPNYINIKKNSVPSTWQGKNITKMAGTGNYTVQKQNPPAGSIPCSTSPVSVGP
jgi:hypothetical protein